MLRGGAYKPGTSPYAFRGPGAEGLKMLRELGDKTGLPIVIAILSPADIDLSSSNMPACCRSARATAELQPARRGLGHVAGQRHPRNHARGVATKRASKVARSTQRNRSAS
jgi:hypothetical protein